MRHAANRVMMNTLGLLIGVGWGCTGCLHVRPPVVTEGPSIVVGAKTRRDALHRAVQWYDSFWRAVSTLNFTNAWTIADNAEQRQLVDALQFMADGNFSECDSAIVPLLSANDTLVRDAARLTYGALLSSRGEWGRLAKFSRSARDSEGDEAGVEAWAPSFAAVRTRVVFDDTVVVLPLTRSRTGAPIVPVRVNGVVRYFWIDTGSSVTIVSSVVAAECGVEALGAVGDSAAPLELVTAVGRIRARPAVVRALGVGSATVHDATAMIVDAAAFVLRGEDGTGSRVTQDVPIDGVIGFDVIRALDLTIDDLGSLVIVRRPVLAGGSSARPRNMIWFGIPIVTLLTERGVPVHLSLDTGAEETYATRTLVPKARTTVMSAERRRVNGFGGVKEERGVLLERTGLFLNDVPLVFERVFLYKAQYPTIFELDGTLGADVGRGGVVRIDMTNGRFEIGR